MAEKRGKPRKRFLSVDIHDFIGDDELAFRGNAGDFVVAYCPFCGQSMKISRNQIKGRTGQGLELKKPVSCGCREGLRYISPRFEREYLRSLPTGKTGYVWKGILALVALLFIAQHFFMEAYELREPPAISLLLLPLPYLLGLIAWITYRHPPERLYQKLRDPENNRERMEEIIREADKKMEAAEAGARWKGNAMQTARPMGPDDFTGHVPDDFTGHVPDDFTGHVPDDFTGYIPDDFEPDLDPYDRQALYEDQMMDDWVIAGGGNPFDYDDRAEAFSDPFGFGDD